MKKRKLPTSIFWIVLGSIIGTSLIIFFIFFSNQNDLQNQNINDNGTISNEDIVEKIVSDYYNTHTYSKVDLFVCSDMSIDVWNLVKTKGINAKICAGNIEKNISNYKTREYFNEINHAWVIAETSPFRYVALEPTGGYLVWGENRSADEESVENGLYYEGFCFDNPAEFKRFIELREDYLIVCGEADQMIEYWNENYAGEYLTYKIFEYRGRMDQKMEECIDLINELNGLLT